MKENENCEREFGVEMKQHKKEITFVNQNMDISVSHIDFDVPFPFENAGGNLSQYSVT